MGVRPLLVPVALTLALGACTSDAPSASAPAALIETPAPAEGPLGWLPEEREQLLDHRADGAALFGVVLAAPLDGDPERVLRLRVAPPNAAPESALDGRRVLDARFAGDGVVTLGVDHVLRFADARGAETDLDARAEGPLSVVGEVVAYTRGEMPLFELARANVRTGAVEPLTNDLAPVWSPALSEDGRSVAFVSSASGHPRLMRLDANGALHAVASERFPTSPRAPRWEGDVLTFEDERGSTSLELHAVGAP